MMTLEIAIDKIKKLSPPQREEVIKFVEFLEFKTEKIDVIKEEIESPEKELSFIEVAQEFIGCLDSDLEDLSYNPKYLEGFGK